VTEGGEGCENGVPEGSDGPVAVWSFFERGVSDDPTKVNVVGGGRFAVLLEQPHVMFPFGEFEGA
jgi:hypothetical protein